MRHDALKQITTKKQAFSKEKISDSIGKQKVM